MQKYIWALLKVVCGYGILWVEDMELEWGVRGGFRSLRVVGGGLEVMWFPMGISIYKGRFEDAREIIRWSKVYARDGNGVIVGTRYVESTAWLNFLCSRIYRAGGMYEKKNV